MTDLDDAPARTRRRPRVEAYTDLDDGRQPPQDLAAEQSVLGGMLLSKDAIADVLETAAAQATSTGPTTSRSTTRSWTCSGRVSPPTR